MLPQSAQGLATIGWREWVRLPAFEVLIKAKVDTGALSSAIHVHRVEEFTDRGCAMVGFTIHPRQRRREPEIQAVAEVVDWRTVRNSGGGSERRMVVLMDFELGGFQWATEVTLARRDQMGFRMLLGRRALRNRFLVDPGASYLLGKVRRVADRRASE
ncbi:MAG: ATP-dependent zinc protease [Planctomycetes bacterium]|nr:ATP-dependent zinc protease [Planctomycetota bacterium]